MQLWFVSFFYATVKAAGKTSAVSSDLNTNVTSTTETFLQTLSSVGYGLVLGRWRCRSACSLDSDPQLRCEITWAHGYLSRHTTLADPHVCMTLPSVTVSQDLPHYMAQHQHHARSIRSHGVTQKFITSEICTVNTSWHHQIMYLFTFVIYFHTFRFVLTCCYWNCCFAISPSSSRFATFVAHSTMVTEGGNIQLL